MKSNNINLSHLLWILSKGGLSSKMNNVIPRGMETDRRRSTQNYHSLTKKSYPRVQSLVPRQCSLLPLYIIFITTNIIIASYLNSCVVTQTIDDSLPSDDSSSKEVDLCESCRLLVASFDKGMDETSRGKHEGGDTSWEEKNLKSYADSEVRLVEIQERLCEELKLGAGKAQCLSLAEDTESEVETWWFKQRNKNVRLFDYLCISKLKRCCASNSYGPNCQSCPTDCNKHGQCDGSGTRSGTGRCNCDSGYIGEECDDCADDHYRIATSDHFTCRKCDSACSGCYGPGRLNCTECRSGYYKHEQNGCIDINECDLGMDSMTGDMKLCKGNKYCVNTDGSYRCADCHSACSGCIGYGPDKCISCALGYQMDDEYQCLSRDEIERMESDWDSYEDGFGQGGESPPMARYFFYVVMIAASLIMFRPNSYLAYTFTLVFMILMAMKEFHSMEEDEDDIRTVTSRISQN